MENEGVVVVNRNEPAEVEGVTLSRGDFRRVPVDEEAAAKREKADATAKKLWGWTPPADGGMIHESEPV